MEVLFHWWIGHCRMSLIWFLYICLCQWHTFKYYTHKLVTNPILYQMINITICCSRNIFHHNWVQYNMQDIPFSHSTFSLPKAVWLNNYNNIKKFIKSLFVCVYHESVGLVFMCRHKHEYGQSTCVIPVSGEIIVMYIYSSCVNTVVTSFMSNEYLYNLGNVIIITQSDDYEYRSKIIIDVGFM